ncbi:hypothetical protein HK105_206347 [Polyrhizophydium stewartii]|uniref:FZ domain-containing protein n=1 Tax=Polyrhizophydium stewartii TaxID=2732419 RepID=A0ABR4N3L3_9FUNG
MSCVQLAGSVACPAWAAGAVSAAFATSVADFDSRVHQLVARGGERDLGCAFPTFEPGLRYPYSVLCEQLLHSPDVVGACMAGRQAPRICDAGCRGFVSSLQDLFGQPDVCSPSASADQKEARAKVQSEYTALCADPAMVDPDGGDDCVAALALETKCGFLSGDAQMTWCDSDAGLDQDCCLAGPPGPPPTIYPSVTLSPRPDPTGTDPPPPLPIPPPKPNPSPTPSTNPPPPSTTTGQGKPGASDTTTDPTSGATSSVVTPTSTKPSTGNGSGGGSGDGSGDVSASIINPTGPTVPTGIPIVIVVGRITAAAPQQPTDGTSPPAAAEPTQDPSTSSPAPIPSAGPTTSPANAWCAPLGDRCRTTASFLFVGAVMLVGVVLAIALFMGRGSAGPASRAAGSGGASTGGSSNAGSGRTRPRSKSRPTLHDATVRSLFARRVSNAMLSPTSPLGVSFASSASSISELGGGGGGGGGATRTDSRRTQPEGFFSDPSANHSISDLFGMSIPAPAVLASYRGRNSAHSQWGFDPPGDSGQSPALLPAAASPPAERSFGARLLEQEPDRLAASRRWVESVASAGSFETFRNSISTDGGSDAADGDRRASSTSHAIDFVGDVDPDLVAGRGLFCQSDSDSDAASVRPSEAASNFGPHNPRPPPRPSTSSTPPHVGAAAADADAATRFAAQHNPVTIYAHYPPPLLDTALSQE